MIAILAVELTIVIGIELAGYYWAGITYLLVFLLLEAPPFLFWLYREGRRYKKKLRKVNELIKKVESKEALGDFDTLMKESKRSIGWRKYVNFGLGCFALSAILFAIQFILLYFQSVITGNSSTYVASTVKSLSSWVDWTAGVLIAVFFGALMIGALIVVIPWDLFEKTRTMRRAKKLANL